MIIHILLVKVDHIDVSGIRPSRLTSAGLLIAELLCEGGTVGCINMVVQVTERGELTRVVFNPLE